MIKKLFKAPLWGILSLSLLSSCRTEDGVINQKQIEDKRFAVFVPESGKTINYTKGFSYLMQRYDELHQTNLSGINNNSEIHTLNASTNKKALLFSNSESYVEFNISSKVNTEENGDKWVVFPKVQEKKVVGLVIASLTEKETYVSYREVSSSDELFQANYLKFQEALNLLLNNPMKINSIASSGKNGIVPMAGGGQKCYKVDGEWICFIEGVDLTKPGNGGAGNAGGGGGSAVGGGCPAHRNCLDPNGGGGGGGGGDLDPCAKIKNLFSDDKFKQKYQKLSNPEVFNLDHEQGAFERFPPKENNNLSSSFVDIENYIGTTNMELPKDVSGIIGLFHSHNNEDKNGNHPIKIFSPIDVRTFLNVMMTQANKFTGTYTNAYSVVTTSEGNYILRYTKDSWPTPSDGGKYDSDRLEKWQNWYEKAYGDLIDNNELTQANVEKIFTQFLNEVVKADGLELYKITETTSTNLKYNGSSNPVKTIPCNNKI
ncbi:hypothetical protein [Elizabethkingia meningoseptica]|uniref:hypothetical protein n=2 Tax=Elizabethkingia meningoseptica TaxID=238 RepID=UPI0021A6BD34|nr:hypothetical protein [Elizabethkingia meningoseptica]